MRPRTRLEELRGAPGRSGAAGRPDARPSPPRKTRSFRATKSAVCMLQGPGLSAPKRSAYPSLLTPPPCSPPGFSRLAGEARRHPLQGFQVQQVHVACRTCNMQANPNRVCCRSRRHRKAPREKACERTLFLRD